MGMATEFQTRSRRGPVLRCRTPKLSLEPQEIFSCTETSTKINLAQLRSARIQGDNFCLRVTDDQRGDYGRITNKGPVIVALRSPQRKCGEPVAEIDVSELIAMEAPEVSPYTFATRHSGAHSGSMAAAAILRPSREE
jgi:hypothetical protein